MTIDIAPETERVVRKSLRAGNFRSVDELIVAAVQAWRERSATPQPPAGFRANGKDKAREFVEWAKGHPSTPPPSDEAIRRASLNPDRW